MSKSNVIIGIVALCVLVIAYLGISQIVERVKYNQQSATLQTTPVTSTNHVMINQDMFGPANIQIKVGTTVTWTNMDSVPHSITLDSGAKDSGLFGQNANFSYTFTTTGTFQYHCSAHPFMLGKVVVMS